MEVNKAVLCGRSLLGLQSPTIDFGDLIQNNRKVCQKIITTLLTGIAHENEILLMRR